MEPISKSVLQIYTSLLPLTKEDSPMSIHYGKYANETFRVEYIGRKQRNDCIKMIRVEPEYVSTNSLLFSPDGTQILSNLEQGVCVWDTTSGELVSGPLLAEDDRDDVLSAAYLSDGRYIITASGNGIIRKWDVLTSCLVWKRVMSNFQMNLTSVESAAFSPDRKSVVFGDYQGRIRVWNVDSGERDGESLEGHTNYISLVSFSPDGKYLVSGSYDTTIIIWDMNKREAKTGPLRMHTEGVTDVNFSPKGDKVVSGSEDRTVYIWDAFTGDVLREIICVNRVDTVTYSPDGLFILAGGRGWMNMWDVTDDTFPPKVFQIDSEYISRVSFSPDGSRFVTRTYRNEDSSDRFIGDTIQIWDASWSVEQTKPTFEEQGKITSIALSPGGNFIASGSWEDGTIYLWNVLSGELVKRSIHNSDVFSVSFSPISEKLIAFGSRDGTVKVWDVTKDESIKIGNHVDSVSSVVFSPSGGKFIASSSWDKTICIWNVERRELAAGPLTGHKNCVEAVAYSPDGTRLVSGSGDRTLRIWNSETGQLLSTLDRHSNDVNSVAYSFDGSRIVSGSDDNTIIVWDAQSGEIVCGPINGHEGGVCFSLDGKRILSGFRDNMARVWDAVTGQPLFSPFSGHTGAVESICFFPDGRRFATGSLDGTIRIWTLDTISNDTDWELRSDNWVVDENGKLMMWVPTDLRTHLYNRRNISMFNRSFYLRLHLDPA